MEIGTVLRESRGLRGPLGGGPRIASCIIKNDAEQSDIHPAYLEDLLARSSIGLIAGRIENENTMVDLLDFDARFGQGFLFSPPRPVCGEAPQNTSAMAEATKLAGDSLNETIVADAAFG